MTMLGRVPIDTRPCPVCGEEILAVAIKCKHCEELIAPSRIPAVAASFPIHRAPDEDGHHTGFLAAIQFPFREPDGLARVWWLALIDYIPLVDLVILRGWQLEVVGRLARGQKPALPEPALMLQFLRKGLLLWTMTLLYSLVPIGITNLMGWGGVLAFIADVGTLFSILKNGGEGFFQFFKDQFVESLLVAAVNLIWILLSFPLYRAAMIRYSLTQSAWTFADLLGNVRFLAAFPGSFLKLYMYSVVLTSLIAVVSGLLLLTGIGALLIPIFAGPVYFWTNAAEYGHLGNKLAARLAKTARAKA